MDVRSVEQPVNPDDDDDIFLYPYLHAGMPTNWVFTDAQAKKLREYFLCGGFMVCDSFFGTQEWEGFERGIRQIFPDREIVELPDEVAIFHTALSEVSSSELPVDDPEWQHLPGGRKDALLAGDP